jgi:predicted acyltransferase
MRSSKTPREKMRWLLVAGAVGVAAGLVLDATGVCPSVKRIWTPSWVLFSGGWCFWLLAAFYAAVDLAGWRKPAFPLVVIGENSIAAYLMTYFFEEFIHGSLVTHLGTDAVEAFGAAYEPFVMGSAILFVYWVILYWMYRRRLFLRI